MLKCHSYPKEKLKVYAIGMLHFISISIGIWSLVDEMIDSQEPVSFQERDIPYFLLPWLLAALITFFVLTMLTLNNVIVQEEQTSNILIQMANFTCVVAAFGNFNCFLIKKYIFCSVGPKLNYKVCGDKLRRDLKKKDAVL
ncbi:hypothetical protein NQ317_006049 [Molorchus minor]|uniref:Olfactory receptor n=1 Tax=Molorchus minor TaxID=1323400 RepID=A0ABQ9K3L5_9CUCU|nr:hypothetical protein NQ317_006049 [Molorchus minor]